MSPESNPANRRPARGWVWRNFTEMVYYEVIFTVLPNDGHRVSIVGMEERTLLKVGDFIPMCWRLVLRNRRRYKVVIFAIALGTMGFIIIRTMGDSVERNISQKPGTTR